MFPIYDIVRIRMNSPNKHSFRTVYTLPNDAMIAYRYIGGGNPATRVSFGTTTIASGGRTSDGSGSFFFCHAPAGSVIQRYEGSGGGTGSDEVVIYLLSNQSKAQVISTNGSGV
jgi:hypothetical protein